MDDTLRIVMQAKRALSMTYATLASTATDDESSDYWWGKHLDMEEQLANS
jgi:hypothetical protein